MIASCHRNVFPENYEPCETEGCIRDKGHLDKKQHCLNKEGVTLKLPEEERIRILKLIDFLAEDKRQGVQDKYEGLLDCPHHKTEPDDKGYPVCLCCGESLARHTRTF